MKKQSQEAWILDQLISKGSISRNQCLKRFISRLGAHIADIKAMGHEIDGKYVKTKNGKDYVYTLWIPK